MHHHVLRLCNLSLLRCICRRSFGLMLFSQTSSIHGGICANRILFIQQVVRPYINQSARDENALTELNICQARIRKTKKCIHYKVTTTNLADNCIPFPEHFLFFSFSAFWANLSNACGESQWNSAMVSGLHWLKIQLSALSSTYTRWLSCWINWCNEI
jgi:hypothetical protein